MNNIFESVWSSLSSEFDLSGCVYKIINGRVFIHFPKTKDSLPVRVKITKNADGARNFSQCDSLLIGNTCGAHTFPYVQSQNSSAQIEHEATTAKIGEEQIFYCQQRGLSEEEAVSLIVNGFCKEVFKKLPMEFAVEAQNLIGLKLEGSVG